MSHVWCIVVLYIVWPAQTLSLNSFMCYCTHLCLFKPQVVHDNLSFSSFSLACVRVACDGFVFFRSSMRKVMRQCCRYVIRTAVLFDQCVWTHHDFITTCFAPSCVHPLCLAPLLSAYCDNVVWTVCVDINAQL